jgi:hypothetical protein
MPRRRSRAGIATVITAPETGVIALRRIAVSSRMPAEDRHIPL